MQRTRFFTVSERDFGAEWALRLPWVPALACLLVAGTAALIAAHPNTPMWDQAGLLESRLEAPWYPSPPYGFTAQLLVVALRPFAADMAALDTLVRVVAMAFWAGAATWLATALLRHRGLQAALLAALFTSQFAFLWLSTELVAGGFLCLAIGARVRGAPAWAVGVLLALLALVKPELLLVSVTLGVVFAWERRETALALAAGFGGALAVLLAPGLAYLDFVALSVAKGVRKVGWTFHWAWLAVPLLVFARRRAGIALDGAERALLWTAIGCVPFVVFAYPHIRYFARYVPIFWLLVLLSVEKLMALPDARRPRHALVAAGLVLLLAFAQGVERASVGLALADRLDPYWFPD